MATEQQTSMPTSSSSSDKNVYYYIHDADLPDLSPSVQKFFEQYSKIPANQVQAHVLELVLHLSSPLALVIFISTSLGAGTDFDNRILTSLA